MIMLAPARKRCPGELPGRGPMELVSYASVLIPTRASDEAGAPSYDGGHLLLPYREVTLPCAWCAFVSLLLDRDARLRSNDGGHGEHGPGLLGPVDGFFMPATPTGFGMPPCPER